MPHDPRVCLEDAIAACRHIFAFTEGYDLVQYNADLKTQAAVERQFEIIGEALNRVRKIDQSMLEGVSELQQIIDFRNVIAHGYDVVANHLVYATIRHDLPRLLCELESAIVVAE